MFESKREITFFIDYSKALAIFCVLLAHCCIWNGDSYLGHSFSLILKNIGTMGVAVFFVISGFLFDFSTSKKKTFIDFSVTKIRRICFPWFFSALVFFLYMYLRHNLSMSSLLLNVIGVKSFYWYLTITMELYFVYYFAYKCKKTYALVAILGLMSLFCSLYSFVFGDALFDSSLNPIRWFYFFSAGVLFSFFSRSINEHSFRKIAVLSGILIVFAMLFLWHQDIALLYKSLLYIPIATFGSVFVIYIAFVFAKRDACNWLSTIGKYSFGIYLYQMFPWTGLLVAFANRFDMPFLILCNPFICLFLCFAEFEILRLLFSRFKKEKYMLYVFGIPIK